MYKSRPFWLLILQLIYTSTFAQGEANNWYFGVNAGLDFNSGIPVPLLDGQITQWEGTAIMSDSSGQLLFYTDGATVFNRNHDTLFNGSGLLGENSSTQSALIIPKPGSNTRYLIFTTEAIESVIQPIPPDEWKLAYSELDMTLDGGLGGITATKNVVLYFPSGEKLTAVKHANNQDIWVLAHGMSIHSYMSFLVTNDGVNTIPIISEMGTVDTSLIIEGTPVSAGYMKASPDGNTVASVFYYANKVDVLKFNKANGQFNFRFTLDSIVQFPYGIEFSPNSELLYVSGYYPSVVRQFQIQQSDNLQEVIANSVEIYNNGSSAALANALQLGPDQKIYIVSFASQYIHRIENPNSIGLASNFIQDYLFLGGPETRLGLPNFFPNLLYKPSILSSGFCNGDSIFFTALNGDLADSVKWKFGDLGNGTDFQAEGSEVFHLYNQPGVYSVNAYLFSGNTIDTLNYTAYIIATPVTNLVGDFGICPGDTVFLTAFDVPSITWQDGSTDLEYPVTIPGIYWASSTIGCSKTDTVSVSWNPPIETTISIADCIPISVNGITYSESGNYYQNFLSVLGCDSILIINAEIQNINAQISQQGSSLIFNGNPTSIQWINCSTGQAIPGATETSFVPQTTGNYGAIITIGECVDSSNCRQIIQSSMPEKPGSLCDNLIVTPNPVNDQIEFTLDKSVYDIRLFTSTGALVLSTKGNAQKQIINFQDLARAMYVLQVDECRFKIVKQ
jgi:hypothetical protein